MYAVPKHTAEASYEPLTTMRYSVAEACEEARRRNVRSMNEIFNFMAHLDQASA
jgi:hypothetical protein